MSKISTVIWLSCAFIFLLNFVAQCSSSSNALACAFHLFFMQNIECLKNFYIYLSHVFGVKKVTCNIFGATSYLLSCKVTVMKCKLSDLCKYLHKHTYIYKFVNIWVYVHTYVTAISESQSCQIAVAWHCNQLNYACIQYKHTY